MSANAARSWLAEPPIGGFQQRVEIASCLHRSESQYQKIEIFDTITFGKTLVLDGAIQTTTGDEYSYHEMLVHPALLAHRSAKNVLVVGGGDGGTLRRVLEHPVDRAVMVELDAAVVDVCSRYLPEIGKSSLRSDRSEILIDDGTQFVASTSEKFDIVLVDSTDPIGPARALFEDTFYRNLHRILREGGLVVTQSGSPLLMAGELTTAAAALRRVFTFVRCYTATVPSYPGGLWSFLLAGDLPELAEMFSPAATARARDQIDRKRAQLDLETRYYTPDVHFGAFALPGFIHSSLRESISA